MTTAPTRRTAQLTRFINAEHTSDEAMRAVGDWYRGAPSRPIALANFLQPGWAEAMATVLRELPVWTRVARVYDGTDSARYVTEEEWAADPLKWARSWIGAPLDAALETGAMSKTNQHALEQFLAFAVLGGPLRDWLQAATGVALARAGTVEFAAYGPDDMIGVHQDKIGARVFALNFYLDEEYCPGSGARLGYRNEVDEEFYVDPLFNTLSMIPIEKDSVHWVEPFHGELGRYTISVGQNKSEESDAR